MSEELMPIFETYQEREEWIKDHATYFTITWMKNLEHFTFYYSTLEKARKNAQFAAKHIAMKPILIYAVYCPIDGADVGYSTWVESVYP